MAPRGNGPEAIVSAISVTFNPDQEYNAFCFYRNLIGYVTHFYDDVLKYSQVIYPEKVCMLIKEWALQYLKEYELNLNLCLKKFAREI